jgi:hypothetical protein
MSHVQFAKILIQLGKESLKNKYPDKTFEELKSELKETSHRKLPIDWNKNISSTNIFNKDIKVHTLNPGYSVLISGKSMSLKNILNMYEKKELEFTFTYSKKFNMIFLNFVIQCDEKVNYVIEIQKDPENVECYSYYKATFEEEKPPALYQIIGRMFTNEIAETWTGGKFKTQEEFETEHVTEDKFSKETIVRC